MVEALSPAVSSVSGSRQDPLAALIGPACAQTFFDQYYERAPLVCARREPGRYASLLTMEEVDAFIDGGDLRQGMLHLVHDTRIIAPGDYADDRGCIIASAVADHYGRGATIILPHLDRSLRALANFCRALEAVFSAHAQANAYLTPPGGHGFAPHYDTHDVFILQVAGAKNWRLYDRPVALPYCSEPFEPGRHQPGAVNQAITLQPGDSLYIPRGLMHDADTEGGVPSLHISIGLVARSWADLIMESVAQVTREEPAFRDALPPGYADPWADRGAIEARFQELIALVARTARLDGALDSLADAFVRERRPSVAGIFADAGSEPSPEARYRRRPFLQCRLREEEEGMLLIGPGGDLLFSRGDRAALELALSGEAFQPGDLPAADPMALVRRLRFNGYLERLGVS